MADDLNNNVGRIDFKETCFFCGFLVKLTDSRKRGIDVNYVKDPSFQSNVENKISQRNDEWAEDVKNRIGMCDLVSAGAGYHKTCSVNFQTFKSIPAKFGSPIPKKRGRPSNETRNNGLAKLIEYMEGNTDKVFAIKELCSIMQQEMNENQELIENRFLKKKLMEHFSDKVMIVSSKGKNDLILFRDCMEEIVTKFYEDQKSGHDEKHILTSAAHIVKREVMSIVKTNKDIYPSPEMIADLELNKEFLPGSLYYILGEMFTQKNKELKIMCIGQAIMQAIRPRAIIAPLQFGLGVQMHHNFGSKFLLDTLYSMGFSVSYSEVRKFEICAAATANDNSASFHNPHNQVVKFVADNIDHDTRTIDGKGTFHGMGIIAAHTPKNCKINSVVRREVSIDDVRAIGKIKIIEYTKDLDKTDLNYGSLNQFEYSDNLLHADLLLNTVWTLRPDRPSWSGVMQAINHNSHPGASSITILPMIDLSPSDPTCIYSTLYYVCEEAERHGVTPVLAFDQPLFWKAQLIIENEPDSSKLKKMVLLLGGFHTQMSFLGAIGHLMNGTGLHECLETVYASNSIIHMLSGKSVSRAVRAHFLVDTALNVLLLRAAQELLPDCDWNSMLKKNAELYDELISFNLTPTELSSQPSISSLRENLGKVKTILSARSRTAKLWIQYMDMVDLLRQSLRSERIGNWNLHLGVTEQKLSFLAASGHNNYTKSIYIYLQKMHQLNYEHPDVYSNFMSGHHVIRQSDRYWAGRACDLTVEQSLMRPAKSKAGLTRGRGISEDQRMIWIQSMPACTEVNMAMQQFTQLYYETSDQHKDCSESRQTRDTKDIRTILQFLEERNPFSLESGVLRNIYTGEQAQSNVNADNAVKIGSKILSSMAGNSVSKYTFKDANKAVTMDNVNTIVIDGEVSHIDPQLLFQRLMLIARKLDDDKFCDVFKYELSQKPSSLFDELGLMREAKPKVLIDEMIAGIKMQLDMCDSSCTYIMSGDSFLNKVPWEKNLTFHEICGKYIAYASNCNAPTIVFANGTIKDEFHIRNKKGIQGVNVVFSENTVFNSKKEHFLANKRNRNNFIKMLAKLLVEVGCTILQVEDHLEVVVIAKKASELAIVSNVIVVSNEMHLLPLLCYHMRKESCDIYLKMEANSKKMPSVFNVKNIIENLGNDVVENIPFIDAICGSSSTSQIYGIGKGTPLKKFKKCEDFRSIAKVFLNPNSSKTEIIEAGNRAISILYNGKPGETLDSLRHRHFQEKVVTKKCAVLIQSLAPTTAASKYHSLRVFLQVQQWIGNIDLNAVEYGWKKDQRFRPITTDLEPAPAELLKFIRCKCKGSCDTLKCTCFKNNFKCSSACGECRGINCKNCDKIHIEDDEHDDPVDK